MKLAPPSELVRLKGIGPRFARVLEAKLGVCTIEDLLRCVPRDYYDRTRVTPIASLQDQVPAVVEGTVDWVQGDWVGRQRLHITRARVRDASGSVTAVWYNQPFMARVLSAGDRVLLWGTPDSARGFHLNVREYERLEGDEGPVHFGGWVPVYHVPAGIPRRAFRRIMREAVQAAPVRDPLPEELRRRRGLMGLQEAYRAIHFPPDLQTYERARRRLAYDEFFFLQAALALMREHVRRQPAAYPLRISRSLDLRIRARLPFRLTAAQERVIGEIRADLESGRPMNRLLQGDVGSGKTIVAAYAALAAIGHRTQACIMAPTDVLAAQHFETFSRLLKDSKVRLLLLASRRGRQRQEALRRIAEGEADLVIGTHALIEEDVTFKALSLVVIDEQHKFGVAQRAKLVAKGRAPHVLVMTATPIPRTLAMTVFGDLDVSVIDEMPPGRKPPRTFHRTHDRLPAILEFIRRQLAEGRQAYFVYPAIEESEKAAQLRAATTMYERLREELRDFRVALLHGRLKSEEKEQILKGFASGEIQALVSTVVIEVGIDVPNATIMVIDNAERFGLSQLHQLRGRIGRGPFDSYCILLADPKTEEARRRIAALLSTTDGFKIAERDLEIRGPGEFLGTRQSGALSDLRVANLVTDVKLLGEARADAFEMVRRGLAQGLLEAVRARHPDRLLYVQAR